MLRRNARLRREVLYGKSLEGEERERYEQKLAARRALAEGKPLPTELRRDSARLMEEIRAEDDATGAAPKTHVDDEYARAGLAPPKVLLTTARAPSPRLAEFAKELSLVFPNTQRVNRGGQTVKEIVEAASGHGFTDIVVAQEKRGEPDGLVVCHLPFGPTAFFSVSGAVTRHDLKRSETTRQDLGTVSGVAPHVILDNLSSKLGQRIGNVLKHLFPPPKAESKRVVTFANREDFVSFRHHMYERPKGAKEVTLKEVGPRFELRLYQLRLGTLDQTWAEDEWVFRPYQRGGKRQKLASA